VASALRRAGWRCRPAAAAAAAAAVAVAVAVAAVADVVAASNRKVPSGEAASLEAPEAVLRSHER
jgi:hypothetical protein